MQYVLQIMSHKTYLIFHPLCLYFYFEYPIAVYPISNYFINFFLTKGFSFENFLCEYCIYMSISLPYFGSFCALSTPPQTHDFLNYYFHNMQYVYINTTLCRLMSLICFCINTDNLDRLTYQGYCTQGRLNHQQPLVASTSSSSDRAL